MTTPAHRQNRLAQSTSPYLLQHAGNPVDWWPWCDEAFEEARRRDVPVFLSIGYSTCYWCHVMERESFEDPAVAAMLNERFVCIKVDREERPDVDEVYMAATVLMTGRGGWPMTVFVEPESRRPYYCGTYFPAEPRPGMPTIQKVCEAMSAAWSTQREGVRSQAEALATAVRDHLGELGDPVELGQAQVADAVSSLLRTHDRTHGGFGTAPKFPQPSLLEFLMDVRARAADDATGDAIDLAVRSTLDKMMLGGVRDHIGGGFHRYSVDESWTVPHFEKMLTDQAGMLRVYARAARWFGDDEYRRCAIEIAVYVAREMTLEDGTFASAQDAQVDGREGLNYLWTPELVREALAPAALAGSPELMEAGNAAATLAIAVYGLDQPANFRDPHHPSEPARWVPRLGARAERIAAALQMSPAGFVQQLGRLNAALREARDARPRPMRDDKALAAWNGAMIAALAVAARELEEPAMLVPARRAMDAVLAGMRDGSGELLRARRDGRAHTPAFLEDHAWLATALLELARSETDDARDTRLAQAADLIERARAQFSAAGGVWFDSRADARDLFVRGVSTHDGATPCGVSVLLHTLIDLAEMTGQRRYAEDALRGLAAVSGRVAAAPVGAINSTRALLRLLIAGEASPGADRPASREPVDAALVEVYATTDRVALAEDTPAEVRLVVKVADGWHAVAADPGPTTAARGLRPFRVEVIGGTGVRAYADYPEGEAFGSGDRAIRVYSGTFEVRVALERVATVGGRPLVAVFFQACNDRECREPGAVELDIAIDAE